MSIRQQQHNLKVREQCDLANRTPRTFRSQQQYIDQRYYVRMDGLLVVCTVPGGWDYVEAPANEPLIAVRRNIPLSAFRFGIISYPRQLSKEELEAYSLEAI